MCLKKKIFQRAVPLPFPPPTILTPDRCSPVNHPGPASPRWSAPARPPLLWFTWPPLTGVPHLGTANPRWSAPARPPLLWPPWAARAPARPTPPPAPMHGRQQLPLAPSLLRPPRPPLTGVPPGPHACTRRRGQRRRAAMRRGCATRLCLCVSREVQFKLDYPLFLSYTIQR